jgi:enoyl-CoA hydratase/carnithine racemase
MSDVVMYSVHNGVATMLNRPDRLNALNDQMYERILAAFDRGDGDEMICR